MTKLPFPTPGDILEEEFLKPFGITHYRLAKEIGVQQRRIDEIVSGDRGVTPDTALRLSRYFGLSDGFWINIQADFDARTVKEGMREVLEEIEPFATDAVPKARKAPKSKPYGKITVRGVKTEKPTPARVLKRA